MTSGKVELQIVSGPLAGQTLSFDSRDSVLVGRSRHAQLKVTDDPHVSRNHFLIEVKPPRCHIVDLESANGTFVNDERIESCWLNDGDTVRGGETAIGVRLVPTDDALAETFVGSVDAKPAEDLSATYVPPPIPEEVGDYRLFEQIGKGSTGVVYRAKQKSSGRIVAMKIVAPELKLSPQLEKSFIREAGILCAMSHKRIVDFIEVGSFDDRLFMAMEYVDTVNVEETLAGLSFGNRVRVACGLMKHLLEGLEFVHEHGLVHRDIKPANLLAYKDGGAVKAKLADFGLAKNFESVGLSQISSDYEIKGTLCFIAPEQLINSRHVTPAADIFSAGATMYTMLSGEVIYDLNDQSKPLATILNQGPIPLNERSPEMPELLCKFVNKATRTEAAKRFASAREMRKTLEQIIARF